MKTILLIGVILIGFIVLSFVLILPDNKRHITATPTITISTAIEKPVNPYLFGADAPNWRDSDPKDTSLTNKIISIAPTLLMTPENGIRCNYAHWKNPHGYGFDSTELLQLKDKGVGGPPLCLRDMMSPTYKRRNYTVCFDELNSILNVPIIYGANIVTGTIDETTDYVKKYNPKMVLLGVELFLPNIQSLFPTVQDYINKAKPFSEAIKKVNPKTKIVIQVPYYGTNGPINEMLMSKEWTEAFQKDTTWYDYIATYNWNQAASKLNTDQPLESAFNDGKQEDDNFFNGLTDSYNYFQQNFPAKKIVVEQWGINDTKNKNNGSIFGNTMLFALHVGRYLSWLAANQNNTVAAAIFGGYLSCNYAPTTAIYAPHDQGNPLHSTYYETTVSKALRMMSDAFHGNSSIETTNVANATDLYAQSFLKNGKQYLYIENYSNSPQTIKITVNSATLMGAATQEELYGNRLYSSMGWTMWEKTYTYEKVDPSEIIHDTKNIDINNIIVQPYSLTKIIF